MKWFNSVFICCCSKNVQVERTAEHTLTGEYFQADHHNKPIDMREATTPFPITFSDREQRKLRDVGNTTAWDVLKTAPMIGVSRLSEPSCSKFGQVHHITSQLGEIPVTGPKGCRRTSRKSTRKKRQAARSSSHRCVLRKPTCFQRLNT